MSNDRSWPHPITEYVREWIFDIHSPAFLLVDPDGRVSSRGGALSRYGLNELQEGDPAVEHAYFLEGLLPTGSDRSILSRVETNAGVYADIHLFRVPQGDWVLLLDATEDVAERTQIEQALRQAEERLRHAEKMEALGRLAGGVAHDFNNLLTVILGYSQMMTAAEPAGILHDGARAIAAAAQRAAGMTQHLLSFSRRQLRRMEVVDLNRLTSDMEQMLRRLIGEDIVLTCVLGDGLSCVEADRGQMEQVLVNLAANARDAMATGGRLEVRTANILVDEPFLELHPAFQLRHGPHVSLSVTDTGCGMDEITVAHAFEPFFTSKPVGKGTGLGLSIVYGIIRQTGGDIVLTSKPGQGTCVEVVLPAVAKNPANEPVSVAQSPAGGTETVLVVEDEEGVRNLIRTILVELGYKVMVCSDAAEAMAICEQHAGAIDLLLTDLIMPQMDGGELAGRITALRPETRVLYVSGYAMESFARRGVDLPGILFLEKPFTPEQLARKVREVLALPRGAKQGSQRA